MPLGRIGSGVSQFWNRCNAGTEVRPEVAPTEFTPDAEMRPAIA
ncbi:MAG: hypothetical protein ABSD59_01530 [Terracidiphilus sp.]